MSKNAEINANSTDSGDGGRVILWGDEVNNFYGTISAYGGVDEGNGGFIEVSSLTGLNYQGMASAKAFNGLPGELLLDPVSITVRPGATDPAFPTSPGEYKPLTGSGGDPTTAFLDRDTLLNTLAAAGGNTSVTLDTTGGTGGPGKVTLDPQIANASWSGDATLTVNATTDIDLSGGFIRGGGTATSVAFDFTAGGNIIFDSSAGDATIDGDGIINMAATGDITLGSATSGFEASVSGKDMTISANNLSILGGNAGSPQSNSEINAADIQMTLQGDLNLTANTGESSISGANMTFNITGDVNLQAGAADADISQNLLGSASDIHINLDFS